jgi:hypothetical protein
MFGESFRNATAVPVDQPAILPVRRDLVQKLTFRRVSAAREALFQPRNFTIGKLPCAARPRPDSAPKLVVFSK